MLHGMVSAFSCPEVISRFALLVVFAFSCASTAIETIRASAYDLTDLGNPNPVPTRNLTAGNLFVTDLLITDQATNASLGEMMGFCVVLRNGGPSQCQMTLQLASGTVQVGFPFLQILGLLEVIFLEALGIAYSWATRVFACMCAAKHALQFACVTEVLESSLTFLRFGSNQS